MIRRFGDPTILSTDRRKRTLILIVPLRAETKSLKSRRADWYRGVSGRAAVKAYAIRLFKPRPWESSQGNEIEKCPAALWSKTTKTRQDVLVVDDLLRSFLPSFLPEGVEYSSMASNQQPGGAAGAAAGGGAAAAGGGGGLSWEEQQMQLAMALSLGMQQTGTPTATTSATTTPASATPGSAFSAADVAAALASVTPASETASASPGLTQQKLEAALAAATAATGASGAASGGGNVASSGGGAVRPRPAATTLDPVAVAALKNIFDVTIGEAPIDRDELERAVKRRATQQAGGAALEYLATAHSRATEDGSESATNVLAIDTVLAVARGLLVESGDAAQVLEKVMQLPPAFLCLLSAEESASQESALAGPFRAAARAIQNATLDDPDVEASLELFRRLVVTSPHVCRALADTIEREAKQARRSTAAFFEASTACGILSISPMALVRVRELSPQFSDLDQMARNPGQNTASKACSEVMAGIWDKQHLAVKKLLRRVHAQRTPAAATVAVTCVVALREHALVQQYPL